VSRQYEAKKRVAELKKQETVPNLRITSSTRVPADDAGSSFRGKHFQATAPRIGKGSTNIGAAKVSRSTRNDEVKQTSLPNKSSPRRKGPNRGVSDNPVTVISPALTEMLRQLHNRLDENAQLVCNS
jgi:Mn-containing catalase